jgi:hypothetical protein
MQIKIQKPLGKIPKAFSGNIFQKELISIQGPEKFLVITRHQKNFTN